MTARWTPGDDELDQLARTLDPGEPAPDRAEQNRTALLASAAGRPQLVRRSHAPLVVAGLSLAAAAAAVVWLAVRPGDRSPVALAPAAPRYMLTALGAPGAARWQPVTGWPDLVIRVDDGRLAVQVAALAAGARFRVRTADAEVEVRGTAFEVGVDAGRLSAVTVQAGRVEVRVVDQRAVILGAGESWTAMKTAQREPAAPGSSSSADASGRDVAAIGRTPATAPPPTVVPPAPLASAATSPANRPPPPPPVIAASPTGPSSPAIRSVPPPSTAAAPAGPSSPANRSAPSPARSAPPRSVPSPARSAPSRASPPLTSALEPDRPSTGEPAPSSASSPGAVQSPPGAPHSAPRSSSQAQPLPARPGEAEFRAGMAALRAGDAATAASRFAAACRDARGDTLDEDACFWAGAAAKRAGDSAAARAALADLLQRFPTSARAPEAAALLGWLLYDAGEIDAAEALFHRAEHDRVPQVRDSAARGLTAIDRQRRGAR